MLLIVNNIENLKEIESDYIMWKSSIAFFENEVTNITSTQTALNDASRAYEEAGYSFHNRGIQRTRSRFLMMDSFERLRRRNPVHFVVYRSPTANPADDAQCLLLESSGYQYFL
jgi:hypothetical protein